MSDALDALVESCGGYILGTGPRDGKSAGGEWDYVREQVSRATMRKLVLFGMAGKVRPFGAILPAGLRGLPTDPDTLAHAIAERGHGPADLDTATVVEWYVARVDQIAGETAAELEQNGRPDPDALPAWVDAWVARLVCPVKRAYVLDAARSLYWGEDVWPAPVDTGAAWELKVWRKLGNRNVAEVQRGEVPA